MISFDAKTPFWRAISALTLCAYLLSSLGMMPSPRFISEWMGWVSGERYPCEGCGCVCISATECWTHCCCHTEQERLVWAVRNGVTPPSSVRFSAAQWSAARAAVACRGKRVCDAHCGDAGCVEGRVAKGRGFGPSISALSCKGLKQSIAAGLPPAVLGGVVIAESPAPNFVVAAWPADAVWESRGLDIPVPPPRA